MLISVAPDCSIKVLVSSCNLALRSSSLITDIESSVNTALLFSKIESSLPCLRINSTST